MTARALAVVRPRALLGAALLALGTASATAPAPRDAAALDAFDLRPEAATQLSLAHRLREISDLTVTPEGRLLAIADERATVFELDPRTGAVARSFTLGTPPLRGDFEALASAGARLFAMTSDGVLHETVVGADGEAVPFTVHATGLGAQCEIEGLAYEPADRSLIVACKQPRTPELKGHVTLFRWSLERGALATAPAISIKTAEIARRTGVKAFHTSAIAREPRTGHYVLVAGPQRLLAELTPAGALVATRALDRTLHRQPEGIAFLGDSVMLISDEGGPGRATLTAYRHAH